MQRQQSWRTHTSQFGSGNIFFDMTPKHKQPKKKVDKLGFIKIKTTVPQDTLTKVKMRTHRIIENICKSYI